MPKKRISANKPVKKNNFFKIALLLFFLLLLFGVVNTFAPFFFLDLLHFGKPSLSDEQIDKLINPVAPKNYKYPNPSQEALNRIVNCDEILSMRQFPRVNPLCVNIFQTTAEEIKKALANQPYDRIVLYGERSVFDAPISDNGKNYLTNLYNSAKFMDQIAIPRLLSSYGLNDVNYIKVSKPYPYLYYRISSLEEADQVCHYGDISEKVRGCAQGFFSSVIPITAVGPQLSNALPLVRKEDNKRFPYLTHYPADCYANEIFLHETAHLLNDAGQGINGLYVLDSWFNEQIAGFMGIWGVDLVCGENTVILQNQPKVKDVPQALIDFNSSFPAPDLSHEYPEDNLCRQAILTEWYRFLGKDYKANFKKFFAGQRQADVSLVPDKNLLDFLLSLDNSQGSKQFLSSKGCVL